MEDYVNSATATAPAPAPAQTRRILKSGRRVHHAVAIPLPAQGHLNPLMRFCRALSSHPAAVDFTITLVNTDSIHRRFQDLQAQQQQQHEKQQQHEEEPLQHEEPNLQHLLDDNSTTDPTKPTPTRGGSGGGSTVDHQVITARSNSTSTRGGAAAGTAPLDTEHQKLQQRFDDNVLIVHANSTPTCSPKPSRGNGSADHHVIIAGSKKTSTLDGAAAGATALDTLEEAQQQLQQQLDDNVVVHASSATPTRGSSRADHEDIAGANIMATRGVVAAHDEGVQLLLHDVKEQKNIMRSVQIPIEGLNLSNDFRLSLEVVFQTLDSHMPAALERLLHEGLGPPPVTCLISDVFITGPTQRVADSFHLPRIAFYPSSAASLLLALHVLRGDRISYPHVKEALKSKERNREVLCEGLLGLPTIYNTDIFDFKHVEDDNNYMWEKCLLDILQESISKAHAMVVNTFEALEGPALRALSELLSIPVYAVGPLVEPLHEGNNTSLWKEDESCMLWLDQQPVGSVLYISFGSVTLLSQIQFKEFVKGILACEQRFLWVFRPDLVENSPFPNFSMDHLLLAQAQGKGCVVEWAPQVRVLSHPSVGGFLTHCGWNSTIESITHGVPMLCWPYFSDQFLDAKFVVEEWKIGLRFEEDGLGKLHVVKSDQVEKMIRALMQGKEGEGMRRRLAKLKDAGNASNAPRGQSWKHLAVLVQSLG